MVGSWFGWEEGGGVSDGGEMVWLALITAHLNAGVILVVTV